MLTASGAAAGEDSSPVSKPVAEPNRIAKRTETEQFTKRSHFTSQPEQNETTYTQQTRSHHPRQGHPVGACRNMGITARATCHNPCENNHLPPYFWHCGCIAMDHEAEDSDTTGARRRRFRPG